MTVSKVSMSFGSVTYPQGAYMYFDGLPKNYEQFKVTEIENAKFKVIFMKDRYRQGLKIHHLKHSFTKPVFITFSSKLHLKRSIPEPNLYNTVDINVTDEYSVGGDLVVEFQIPQKVDNWLVRDYI